jgi:hypothetical protein
MRGGAGEIEGLKNSTAPAVGFSFLILPDTTFIPLWVLCGEPLCVHQLLAP